MEEVPEAALLRVQRGVPPQQRHLGDRQRTDHVDDHRQGRQSGEESDEDQQATPDLEDTVEVGKELSGGNACLDEAAGPECIWPEELQDAFADEDQADIEADEDDRTGGPGGGQLDQ